jgi:hypothetical protein
MLLDRPLGVGAAGGHGPVRYFVEQYTPGQCVRFRFTGPKGYDGWHAFDVRPSGERGCILRHTIDMTAHGPAVLSWPLAVRWMHDACVEDAFALAQASLGLPPLVRKWPLRVRLLRWLASGGKSGPQVAPASVAR